MLFRLLIVSFCLSAGFAAPTGRDDQNCGLSFTEPLLNADKGIETAQPHSWPWMVSLCVPKSKSGSALFFPYTRAFPIFNSISGNESAELDCAKLQYGSGTVVGRRWILAQLPLPSQEVMETIRVRTGDQNWLSSM